MMLVIPFLQANPRFSEEFVSHLETELEQSRLRESETLSALKEMQDKVLDMEKVCQAVGGGVDIFSLVA